MATINITRAHSLTRDDAKKKAEELAKGMEEKFSIVWRWEGDTIRFDAPKGAAKGTKGAKGAKATEGPTATLSDWLDAREGSGHKN